jgi:hypothetical protein
MRKQPAISLLTRRALRVHRPTRSRVLPASRSQRPVKLSASYKAETNRLEGILSWKRWSRADANCGDERDAGQVYFCLAACACCPAAPKCKASAWPHRRRWRSGSFFQDRGPPRRYSAAHLHRVPSGTHGGSAHRADAAPDLRPRNYDHSTQKPIELMRLPRGVAPIYSQVNRLGNSD